MQNRPARLYYIDADGLDQSAYFEFCKQNCIDSNKAVFLFPAARETATFELVTDDEEPEEGGAWRAKQPGCIAVEPFVGAASSDAADAGRPKLAEETATFLEQIAQSLCCLGLQTLMLPVVTGCVDKNEASEVVFKEIYSALFDNGFSVILPVKTVTVISDVPALYDQVKQRNVVPALSRDEREEGMLFYLDKFIEISASINQLPYQHENSSQLCQSEDSDNSREDSDNSREDSDNSREDSDNSREDGDNSSLELNPSRYSHLIASNFWVLGAASVAVAFFMGGLPLMMSLVIGLGVGAIGNGVYGIWACCRRSAPYQLVDLDILDVSGGSFSHIINEFGQAGGPSPVVASASAVYPPIDPTVFDIARPSQPPRQIENGRDVSYRDHARRDFGVLSEQFVFQQHSASPAFFQQSTSRNAWQQAPNAAPVIHQMPTSDNYEEWLQDLQAQ